MFHGHTLHSRTLDRRALLAVLRSVGAKTGTTSITQELLTIVRNFNKELTLSNEVITFIHDHDVTLDFPRQANDNNGPINLRYRHVASGRCYRALARWHEVQNDYTDDDLRTLKRIFEDWAVPDIDELHGPVLGSSARVDGLQGCELEYREPAGRSRSAAALATEEPVPAPILLPPAFPGLGEFGRMITELRCEVYKLVLPGVFWQCYDTKRAGLSLLGATHSNEVPAVFRVSPTIREEVLDTMHSSKDSVSKIIIGSQVVAFNFPLDASLEAGQTIDAARARVHAPKASKRLSIGIQVPSPRDVISMAAVRHNVSRVVELLNGIAVKHALPHILVSSHTNTETQNRHYHRSDFEILMGPFHKLNIPRQNQTLKPNRPLTIDRLGAPKNNTITETCDKLERVVSNPAATPGTRQLRYRQLVMDVKLELAAHERKTFLANNPDRGRATPYEPSIDRISKAAHGLDYGYKNKHRQVPGWVSVAFRQFHHSSSLGSMSEAEREKRLGQVVGSFGWYPSGGLRSVAAWANGRSTAVNPFWREGKVQYWE